MEMYIWRLTTSTQNRPCMFTASYIYSSNSYNYGYSSSYSNGYSYNYGYSYGYSISFQS